MKIYTLLESSVKDDQKTIVISEEVSSTKEERITVAQLKERHSQVLANIETLKLEANEIIDKIQEISDNTNLDLTVLDIPVKILTK